MLELLFSDDELTPPAEVAANAARGLRLRARFGRGPCFIKIRGGRLSQNGDVKSSEEFQTSTQKTAGR